ncbi:SICA antigen [Plasmodium coatneyi]|uniref:SICA antigen n=1 Tax=Plasmodium coatneyi TaxID=208452 RepID=A0A1B1E0H5_9APIC|nr:SICA antigen [Plasmodium coatneyi]ANQ08534.1 SICA antigen [Plasmodium coatneyi]
MDDPSDLLTPYLPTIPVLIGTSVISSLLWKYFFLGKKRKRHKRVHKIPDSPPLGEQLPDNVDDQADDPHTYTLVKKRKQPRSAPTGRTKRSRKRGVHRRGGVHRRMIIDIHLEVLDECQKGDLNSTKEDYFTILVQEFMGSEFIKEEYVPEEQVSMVDVPKEQIPSLGKEDLVPKEQVPMDDIPREEVPSSDSGFREEDFLPKESVLTEGVPREQVQCSDS